MTAFHIKVIAILSMVIDHVGLFFFPQYTIPRIIGRLAFPLFAWLIANGAHHTKDNGKYLSRLFWLAVISQIPFTLANQQIGSPLFYLNVVFTLFLGLFAITLIKKTENKFLWVAITLLCAEIANLIHSDYGATGVLSVVAFYLFFEKKAYMLISQAIILSILPYMVYVAEKQTLADYSSLYIASVLESYGLVSLFLIFLYNKKEGPKTKYLFYIFYPVQYIVLYIFTLLV